MMPPARPDHSMSIGVSHGPINAPSTTEVAAPPRKPSQVFLGLMAGVILVRPNSLPQVYCATSLNWVMNTRKKRSPAPPATGFTAFPANSKYAMCDSVNTVIISPQERVPTDLR